MMRYSVVLWLVGLVLAATATIVLWRRFSGENSRSPGFATTHAGPSIEQLQLLASLTTLKIDVADAIITDLRGYLGHAKAVLVVKGDVTLGVDLSAARFEAVDEQARAATLILPKPTVQSVRIDHERTRLIDVRTGGVWTIVPGGNEAEIAAVNRAYRDAQRIVGAVADDPAMAARARHQAEHVVGTFLRAIGWNATIRWLD